MFGKIFEQIFDSSIAEDHMVRHIFMDLIVLADRYGVIDMTGEAIARRINVPVDIVVSAIAKLSAPDPRSRSREEEGKRLIPLEEHRGWGWQIVNYEYYRNIRDEEARRAAARERKQRQRTKEKEKRVTSSHGTSVTVTQGHTESANAYASASASASKSSLSQTASSSSLDSLGDVSSNREYINKSSTQAHAVIDKRENPDLPPTNAIDPANVQFKIAPEAVGRYAGTSAQAQSESGLIALNFSTGSHVENSPTEKSLPNPEIISPGNGPRIAQEHLGDAEVPPQAKESQEEALQRQEAASDLTVPINIWLNGRLQRDYFEQFLRSIHPRSERGPDAERALMDAVEQETKLRGSEQAAVDYIVDRTMRYAEIVASGLGLRYTMTNFYSKGIYDQSEENWKTNGTPIATRNKQQQREDRNRAALAEVNRMRGNTRSDGVSGFLAQGGHDTRPAFGIRADTPRPFTGTVGPRIQPR